MPINRQNKLNNLMKKQFRYDPITKKLSIKKKNKIETP